MKLYEILVPTTFNDGKEIPEEYHHKWDDKIIQLCGGLTILKKSQFPGKWKASIDGETFIENFIPVRIACDISILIEKVLPFTKDYYIQEAVMAYEISQHVIIHQYEHNRS